MNLAPTFLKALLPGAGIDVPGAAITEEALPENLGRDFAALLVSSDALGANIEQAVLAPAPSEAATAAPMVSQSGDDNPEVDPSLAQQGKSLGQAPISRGTPVEHPGMALPLASPATPHISPSQPLMPKSATIAEVVIAEIQRPGESLAVPDVASTTLPLNSPALPPVSATNDGIPQPANVEEPHLQFVAPLIFPMNEQLNSKHSNQTYVPTAQGVRADIRTPVISNGERVWATPGLDAGRPRGQYSSLLSSDGISFNKSEIPLTAAQPIVEFSARLSSESGTRPTALELPAIPGQLAVTATTAEVIRPTKVPAAQPVIDMVQPQAGRELAESVVMQVSKGGGDVRIKCHPEDLGELELQIRVDSDKVSVKFESPNAMVRDVVQSSLQTLNQLLQSRGLSLDQALVQSDSSGTGHQDAPGDQGRTERNGISGENDAAGTMSPETPEKRVVSIPLGRVDDFA